MAFNDSKVRGLKPKSRQYEVFDNSTKRGVGRLGVSVGTSGLKIFIYRYFWEGKWRVKGYSLQVLFHLK